MRLSILHLVFLAAAASTVCPSGVVAQTATHAGHSYTLIMTQNVADARAQAAAMGGYLVSITNQAENDFLLQTFSGASNDFFIGLSDEQSEGVYTWESGQATVYTNWFGGHPVAGPSNYSKFLLSSGKWASGNGAVARPAVVEIEPPSAIFAGHGYRLIWAQNQADARAQATALGGYLVSIGSESENNFIVQTFSGITGNEIYIGLSDEIVEGTFLWDSGEPVSYTNWQSGQPQAAGDYGKLLLGSGEWKTGAGTNPSPAIVEFGAVTHAIYFLDFETGAQGWAPTSFNSSWEYGTPAQSLINSAHSGVKAFMTDLDANYSSNATEFLQSPAIDLSAVTHDPVVSFWINYETELISDTVELQVNNGNGVWNTVPFDSYHPSVNRWTGSSSGWVRETAVVRDIAGSTTVRFRFRFQSDGTNESEGVAIDDFAILSGGYERNKPEATLHFDGLESDGNQAAITVTPELSTLSLESTLSGLPHEIFVTFGLVQPCWAEGSVNFIDGRCVNMDVTDPSFSFVHGGGAIPVFQPMTNAIIPVPGLVAGFSVTAQLVILDITSPTALTLSQAATLRNAPVPAIIEAPRGNDEVVEVDLPYATFYGTSRDKIFMDSNGRLIFDSPVWVTGFAPVHAATGSPCVGVWSDLDPSAAVAGIIAEVTETTFTMKVVDAPYLNSGTPVSFSITLNFDHHQNPGEITLAGLSQLAPTTGPLFLGMSPGGGASNPGPTTFASGASGGGFLPTDMIYDSSDGMSTTIPTSLLGGLDEIVFTPLGSSYTWMGQ